VAVGKRRGWRHYGTRLIPTTGSVQVKTAGARLPSVREFPNHPLGTDAVPLGSSHVAAPRRSLCTRNPIRRRPGYRRHGSTPSGAGRWRPRRKPPRGVLLGRGRRRNASFHDAQSRPAADAPVQTRAVISTQRSQNAGLCPCTPARERPLRRRGLSLALFRPGLVPVQGGRSRSAFRGQHCLERERPCSSPCRRVAGSVLQGARAQYCLAPDPPSQRRPGDKVETYSASRPRVSFHTTRLVRMPCRWAARMLRSRGSRCSSAVQASAAQGTGAMAPRPVAREGGVRGGNHGVVSSSLWGSGRVHRCKTYSRGPLPTLAFIRVLISDRVVLGARGFARLVPRHPPLPTTSAVRASCDTRESLIYQGARTFSTCSRAPASAARVLFASVPIA